MMRPIMSSQAQPSALITLFENAGTQDAAATTGLRERLCAALRKAINTGALTAGQRLPSSRMLATDLKVSRITVEAAYAQTEAEGYLQRHTGKGTFVSMSLPRPAPPRKNATTPAGLSRLSVRGQKIIATGGCRDPQLPTAFAAGSPDLRAFPLKTWKQLTAKALRIHGEHLLGYGDPQGYLPLREAIASYLQQSRGVVCTAGQIMITTSSQQALQLLAMLLIDPADRVWLEQPGYLGARNAFSSAGADSYAIPVDEEGMNPTADYPVPRLIYLTPSHHYPTGVSLSLPRRLQLLDYAKRHTSWIIEDDYDSELHYDGRPLPAMQGLDKHQQVIYLGTFSKVLFPSLRLAYAVLPPALVAPMVTLRTVSDGHSSQMMQAVTAEFINAGHFAAHLRFSRQLYQSRRDHLLDQINQKISWLTPQVAAGGLQLAAHLPAGQEAHYSALAAQAGVETPRLSPLFFDASGVCAQHQDGWLLGFSALTPVEITSAVNRLASLNVQLTTPPAVTKTSLPAR
ncbi:aminotransferase class I/II-fold pyridoxal phosphate-dependent enzyme [Enterobacteriaceae bacterium Kacie_13]|nr:aminotransferase class I/II-fold pyridoxal phosphate-dependent enzyme [Enterobacteriaceae bacterium Kacie_13]